MPSKEKPVRKHVTTACDPCREGKVKCDGSKPSCKNCVSKDRDCSYRPTTDNRKIPVRTAVSLLAARVAALSQLIQNEGCEVPEMNSNDQETLVAILQNLRIPYEGLQSEIHTSNDTGPSVPSNALPGNTHDRAIFTNSHQSATEEDNFSHHDNHLPSVDELPSRQFSLENVPKDDVLDGSDSGVHRLQPGTEHTQCQKSGTFPPSGFPSNGSQEAESEDEVTNRLACRLGRVQLTHDGQLRYFGSTSNLTLLDVSISTGQPTTPFVDKDAQDILESLKLSIEVDETFEKHLLDLYFAWQDPCLHAIHSETFWKAKLEYQYDKTHSPYYSQALCNAMCAIGASYETKYHPTLVTFPRTLSQFFGDRAKALLESEIETPSLATIQALIIISTYEASRLGDTRGWLYSGMAIRLAFDLGLHLDMTFHVRKGYITKQECESRRRIFWASSLNEQFWGYYLGRSVRSPESSISVPRPCLNLNDASSVSDRKIYWRPYGCAEATVQCILNPLDMIFHRWLSLYQLMSPIADVLYGCLEISKKALQELTADTVARLLTWKNSLPTDLRIDATRNSSNYLPHVLTLHMQYHQFIIHCHRPYISKHHIQPQPPQGPGPAHARKMCLDSAILIVNVLNMYGKRYGFRKANVHMVSYIFSATLILIFVTTPDGTNSQASDLMRHLSTCFLALDEMGTCFDHAKRTSTFLSTLMQQWHRRKRRMIQIGTKRGQEDPISSNVSQKRLRGVADMEDWADINLSNLSMEAEEPLLLWSPTPQENQSLSFDGFDASSLVDFVNPELCNVLLGEGIPRANA